MDRRGVFREGVASKESTVAAQALRKSLTLIPASRRIARSVPSAMSPEWCGSVTFLPVWGWRQTSWLPAPGTVELETKRSQTAGNFPVGKSCEASHLRDRNRNAEFALRPNLAPEHSGERIAVFPAGLHDFSGEALSDFDRFGNAAAFGHQSRNIRAGTQIAAILQILDANPNGHFLDFREVLLPLHGRFLRRAL